MSPWRRVGSAASGRADADASLVSRLHALAAVRGGALILGIVLHAGFSFLPGTPVWVVTDPDLSVTLSVVVFTIHSFRMTTFFLIAGFFAHMSLTRLELKRFVRNRVMRIIIPLVLGWAVFHPLMWQACIWAIGHDAGRSPPFVVPFRLWNFGPSTLPLGYLWFLYVLALLYVSALALRQATDAVGWGERLGRWMDEAVGRIIRSPAGPAFLALPIVSVMWLSGFRIHWGGIEAPETGLLPDAIPMAAYGLAFGFGWFVHRHVEALVIWRRRWLANLAAAAILTGLCFLIAGPEPAHPAMSAFLPRLIFAPAYVTAGWLWTFGMIGLIMRFLSSFNATVRYLSDSSYWLYLAHMPLVITLQAALSHLSWPWWTTFPLLLVISMTILLASYQLFVRHTFIGAILNGPRKPPDPGTTRLDTTPIAPS